VAGRILQEDIEQLKQVADLADVIADHTQLKRAGKNLKARCPLHEERTPSFTLDPGQGVWHCFGCQQGGDIYTFLQRIEGLSFVEAVEHLARRVGYQLRYEDLSAGQKRALGERTRLVAANEAAARFFAANLREEMGAAARAYLVERGFGRDEAAHFRIGFAPLEWEALSRHLLEQRISQRDILGAGLAVENRRGGLRDRFRGRIVFPIEDLSGEVIGFGGRVVPGLDYGDHDPPKYLNTAETAIYHKHRVLYGIAAARPEIVRSGEVLVTEGYTDVIALHQSGFGNAVATCGTAVGEEHLRVLSRYADRVILAFDSDEAGGRAAERAWELAAEHELEVKVLVMPAGTDPADVVRSRGHDAMAGLIETAEPVVRFMLRRAIAGHPTSPEGRAAAVEAASAVLATVDDPVLREQYTRWVADEVGVGVGVASEVVARTRTADARGATSDVAPGRTRAPTTVSAAQAAQGPGEAGSQRDRSARARLEREVLRVALQRPDLLPETWYEVTADDLSHPKAKEVFRTLQAAGGAGVALAAVLEAAPDDDTRALIRAIALESPEVEPEEEMVAVLVGKVLLYRLDRDIAARKAAIERLNPTTDPDGYRTQFEQLIALEARRRDLRSLASA
jgi:DNA primase